MDKGEREEERFKKDQEGEGKFWVTPGDRRGNSNGCAVLPALLPFQSVSVPQAGWSRAVFKVKQKGFRGHYSPIGLAELVLQGGIRLEI